MEKLFNGHTVLISGGLGDIGRATILSFASQGAAIALSDLAAEDVSASFVDSIKALGVPCMYATVDVSNAVAVEDWVRQTEREIGTPTIIIANAAVATIASIHEITPEQWSRELRVNLDGAFFMAQAATALLVKKKLPGKVVLVGSWAAVKVHQHMPAYSVAKAGLSMLCRCLALELANHDILVNEIAPGYVAAGLSGRIWAANPGRKEAAIQRVPIRRVMGAEEVAQQIIFLCHPDNRHMTGSTLLMDGGLSLL
jgi:glucose 1-dehydrogenase